MKNPILSFAAVIGVVGLLAEAAGGETTAITAGLNAPVIGASGGSQVYWGPIVTQSTLALSGNTNTNYPQKFAGSSISGSGGAAGSRQYCVNPGDPTSGPGTLVPPSSVPVYEWFCDVNPVPPAPQVDFAFYKTLAQSQGSVCGGRPCYNNDPAPNFSGIYDPVCTVNGQAKVWYFEGDVNFSGSTYFCGVLLSRGTIGFTGGGSGPITMTPPATAWTQYLVATPNGTPGNGDTVAQDEYPGDAGFNTVKNYDFEAGGGGFNGDPVSFQGYIFATTGYSAGGHTLIVGAVQFGQGAASTSGGGTIFYVPQIIFTVPPSSQVAQPVITPPGGSFTGSVSVTITEATPGAAIHYTTDGSVPDQNSALYSVPLTLTADTTVKAIGTRADLNPSTVATAVFTVAAGPANQAPSVNAGGNQTLTLPAGATLTGSATDDGLPDPPNALVYAWNKVSGAGVVTFASASAASTTAGFSQAGTYVLRLTVFDGQLYGSDDVQIVVNAVPPPEIQFSAAAYSASESAGSASITVTRQGTVLTGSSSAQWTTAAGAGTVEGVNFVGVSGTLTFAANETTKTFDVPIINDGLADGDKTVLLSLSSPSGAILGAPNQATLTIQDVGAPALPPPNPFISQLVPYSAPVNFASPFTMRVFGTGFDTVGAQVRWNNAVNLPVISRTASEIDVAVDPSVWGGTVGTYPVVVRNPGNVDSNAASFAVRAVGSSTPPPFIVLGPAADPNPTTGTTSQLTVFGGTFSPGGESVLTYEWQAVGSQPAVLSFSANRTHAASHVTATFGAPGVYYVRVTVTDTVTGFSVNSPTLDVTVVSAAASLTLSPKRQTITPDQRLTLTAAVRDQFGTLLTPTLTWGSSGGTLSASQTSAVLSADSARSIHITAATLDGALSDSADVTVLYGSGGVGDVSQSVPAPVPYRSTSGLPGVTFKRLNPGSKIRIFSPDGRLVQTIDSEAGGEETWRLTNSGGARVASGVYLYILDWNGQTKRGKLVLIL